MFSIFQKSQNLKDYLEDISDDAKDLISKLLKIEPEKRITVQKCLRHPWILTKTKEMEIPLEEKNVI